MNKRAVIRNGQIIYDEDAAILKPNETAARESREDQRVRYRAEILQKNDPDFYKVYPEHAKELPDDVRRLLS